MVNDDLLGFDWLALFDTDSEMMTKRMILLFLAVLLHVPGENIKASERLRGKARYGVYCR